MSIMNIKSRGLKALLAVFLITGLLLIPCPEYTDANGWLDGYSCRKQINITAQAGAGTDYQVPLEVHSGESVPSSLTVQPSAKDTYLNLAFPTSNYGTNVVLTVFDYSLAIRRTILEFDISALPVGATITSASLQLYYFSYVGNDPSGKTIWAYKQTHTDWVEAEATYNIYKTGSNWTVAGGDYATSNPAGGSTTFPAGYDWMSWNVLAIVQDAYTNTIPAEFLVKFETEGVDIGDSSSPDWHSSNYAGDTTLRPKLIIGYTSGDSAGVVCLDNLCTDFPNDIRFTASDGVTELDPFNKDEHNPAADPTHWGIEVKADLDDNQNFYIYFGKSGASSPSDIVAASVFGDHFLGDTLDTDKWNVIGTPVVSGGAVHLNDDDKIYAKTGFGYGYVLETRSKADEQDSRFAGFWDAGGAETNRLEIFNSDYGALADNFDNLGFVTQKAGAADIDYEDNWDDFRDTYCIYRIKRYSATHTIFEQNDHAYTDDNVNIPVVDLYPGVGVWDSSQESTLDCDWLFVRKYVYPEPVVGTPGSLETRERSWGYIIG